MQILINSYYQGPASTHSELVMTRVVHTLLQALILFLCFQRGSHSSNELLSINLYVILSYMADKVHSVENVPRHYELSRTSLQG